jgi:hypothetical protein
MSEEITSFQGAYAKLLYDVAGPTAKYLGKEAASFTEIGVENVKRVFQEANSKLQIQGKTKGAVPSRVLKDVWQQAYFCEDEVQASYLGGVLASSKSELSRDDRAVAYLSILNSLSTYQIHAHAILYSSILRIPPERFARYRKQIIAGGVTVSLLEEDYIKSMRFAENESPAIITQHIFVGLQQHGLSMEGQTTIVQPRPPSPVTGPCRYFYPTALGIELFLWGVGYGDKGFEKYTPELLKSVNFPMSITPCQMGLGHVGYVEYG